MRSSKIFRSCVVYVCAAVFSTIVGAQVPSYDAQLLPGGTVAICGMGGNCSYADTSSNHGNISPGDIGAGTGYVKVTPAGSTDPAITISVGNALPGFSGIPSGWTAGAPGSYPVPPSTAGPGTLQYSMPALVGGQFPTSQGLANAACDAIVVTYGAGVCTAASVSTSVSTGGCSSGSPCLVFSGTTPPRSNEPWGPVTTGYACPVGYAMANSVCTLAEPSLVPYPDNKCEIVRTGNTFTFDSRAAGCGTAQPGGAGKAVNLTVDGGTATASVPGTAVTVTISGSGTGTVTISRPNGSGSATVTTTTGLGSPGTGTEAVITGTGIGTVSGTGSMVGASTPNQAPTCGSAGLPACTVKVDETGTPGGAGALGGASAALDSASTAREVGLTDLAGSAKKTDLGWSLGWTLPTVSCSSWTFTFKDWSRVVDWCGPLGTVRNIYAWFLGLFTAIYIWRRATSAIGS